MLIIPAIDLQGGCVVRYVQGRRDKKIYSRSPALTAKHWEKLGAEFLHVVDLDGAFTGSPKNLDALKEIIRSIFIPIEFGGGVRSIAGIKALLELGIRRVVLGTRAAQDRAFLKKAIGKFAKKIIVAIDAKENKLLTRGWKSSVAGKNVLDFAGELKGLGISEVIYTDTVKDGTLQGPNIRTAKEILKKTGLKLIASGGVASLSDILKLKELEKAGLTGVIIGKALYEGRFTLSEALEIAR